MSVDLQQALKERAARLSAKRRESTSSETNHPQQPSGPSTTDAEELPDANQSSPSMNNSSNHQLMNQIKQEIHELQRRISRLDRERNTALSDLRRKEETLRQLTNPDQTQPQMTSEERESLDRECALYLQRQMEIEENQEQEQQQQQQQQRQQQHQQQQRQQQQQQNVFGNPMSTSNFTFSYSSNASPNINSFFMANNLGDDLDSPHDGFLFGSQPDLFPPMMQRTRLVNFGFPLQHLMNFGLGQRSPLENIDGMDHDQLLRLQELIGHVPRGASEEQIENLPTSKFESAPPQSHDMDEKSKSDDDSQIQKCAICLEQFNDGDQVRTLPCFHIFHKDEIDQWLVRNRACPICRRSIDEQSSQTDASN